MELGGLLVYWEKEKKLISRLSWLDNQKGLRNNSRLDEEYKRTRNEYEAVLVQEEIIWFQKSRAKWLHYGESNTRYIHGVTAMRRRRNSYDMLQNELGEWISGTSQLETMVTHYYQNMFHYEEHFALLVLAGVFPSLSEDELIRLGRTV